MSVHIVTIFQIFLLSLPSFYSFPKSWSFNILQTEETPFPSPKRAFKTLEVTRKLGELGFEGSAFCSLAPKAALQKESRNKHVHKVQTGFLRVPTLGTSDWSSSGLGKLILPDTPFLPKSAGMHFWCNNWKMQRLMQQRRWDGSTRRSATQLLTATASILHLIA